MYNVTINQIAKEMGCSYEGPEGIVVRRVVFDSREVGPGDLFVAIRGQRVDGHRYIDKAIEAGAVAVASEEAIDNPSIGCVRIQDGQAFIQDLSLIHI